MGALSRITQKIFAVNAPSTQLAKFGSLATGSPVTTNDPSIIQALSNFTDGWFSAILGVNSPAIHDMNSLFFLTFRQIAYFFEKGVPEWDPGTTYYQNSIVQSAGILYISLINNNLNNAVTTTMNWSKLTQTPNLLAVSSNTVLSSAPDVVLANTVSGSISVTLPAATGSGKIFKLKKTDTTVNVVSLLLNGGDTLDGVTNTPELDQPYQHLTLIDGGAGQWFTI